MSRIDSLLLRLVEDVVGLVDIDDLRSGLLPALRGAVPAEFASLNEIRPDVSKAWALVDPPVPPEYAELFHRLAGDNPLVERYLATRDGRAYRFSDVCSVDELRSRAIYQQIYGPLGIEHQIAFTLPAAADAILAVALSRARQDFSDDERTLLDRARPTLIQVYRNALDRDRLLAAAAGLHRALRAAGLTAREAEAVSHLARGASNAAIADALGVGQRTVQTHLRAAFRKLDVHDRSAAAERAWALARRGTSLVESTP